MEVQYVKLTDEQNKCIMCGKPIHFGRAYVKLLTDHAPHMRCSDGHKSCRNKLREYQQLKQDLKQMIIEKQNGL